MAKVNMSLISETIQNIEERGSVIFFNEFDVDVISDICRKHKEFFSSNPEDYPREMIFVCSTKFFVKNIKPLLEGFNAFYKGGNYGSFDKEENNPLSLLVQQTCMIDGITFYFSLGTEEKAFVVPYAEQIIAEKSFVLIQH